MARIKEMLESDDRAESMIALRAYLTLLRKTNDDFAAVIVNN